MSKDTGMLCLSFCLAAQNDHDLNGQLYRFRVSTLVLLLMLLNTTLPYLLMPRKMEVIVDLLQTMQRRFNLQPKRHFLQLLSRGMRVIPTLWALIFLTKTGTAFFLTMSPWVPSLTQMFLLPCHLRNAQKKNHLGKSTLVQNSQIVTLPVC